MKGKLQRHKPHGNVHGPHLPAVSWKCLGWTHWGRRWLDVMTNNDTLLYSTLRTPATAAGLVQSVFHQPGLMEVVGLCSAKRQNTNPDADQLPVSGSRQLAHRSKCHSRTGWISADLFCSAVIKLKRDQITICHDFLLSRPVGARTHTSTSTSTQPPQPPPIKAVKDTQQDKRKTCRIIDSL